MDLILKDANLQLQLIEGERKAELAIETPTELLAVHLSTKDLHDLAYAAIDLVNQIRSVPVGESHG